MSYWMPRRQTAFPTGHPLLDGMLEWSAAGVPGTPDEGRVLVGFTTAGRSRWGGDADARFAVAATPLPVPVVGGAAYGIEEGRVGGFYVFGSGRMRLWNSNLGWVLAAGPEGRAIDGDDEEEGWWEPRNGIEYATTLRGRGAYVDEPAIDFSWRWPRWLKSGNVAGVYDIAVDGATGVVHAGNPYWSERSRTYVAETVRGREDGPTEMKRIGTLRLVEAGNGAFWIEEGMRHGDVYASTGYAVGEDIVLAPMRWRDGNLVAAGEGDEREPRTLAWGGWQSGDGRDGASSNKVLAGSASHWM